jgi:hypothetical protein
MRSLALLLLCWPSLALGQPADGPDDPTGGLADFTGVTLGALPVPDEQHSKLFALIDESAAAKPSTGILYIATAQRDARFRRVHDLFVDGNYLMRAASVVEDYVKVPGGLRVIMGECGELNAVYVPSRRAVVVCHELVAHFADHFHTKFPGDKARVGRAVVSATVFAFFHELGHAFFDIFKFPNLGSEEDASDRIAALLMLELGIEAAQRTLEGAEGLLALAKLGEAPAWDVHGFGPQRFFNAACLVLGAAGPNARLTGHADFNRDRAPRCVGEYGRARASLDQMLRPHHKRPMSRLERLLERNSD